MKSILFILTTLSFFQIALAETPVTIEWSCYDQKNSNQAFVPDETNPNKFEEWKVHTESISKPNYSLENFEITGVKKVTMNVPNVGRKQYVLMSYEYTVSGARHWGVFSCHKSN